MVERDDWRHLIDWLDGTGSWIFIGLYVIGLLGVSGAIWAIWTRDPRDEE